MELIVKELSEANVEGVGEINGQFVIDSQLILHAENNRIHYTVVDHPAEKKRYAQEETDYSTYIDNPKRAIFLAWVGETIAG